MRTLVPTGITQHLPLPLLAPLMFPGHSPSYNGGHCPKQQNGSTGLDGAVITAPHSASPSLLPLPCWGQDSPLPERGCLGPLFPLIPSGSIPPFRAGLSAQRSPRDSVCFQFPRPPASYYSSCFYYSFIQWV